jgi:hypothetical protein
MQETPKNLIPFELRREPYFTGEACKVERSFTFVRACQGPVRVEHVVLSVPKEKVKWNS